MYWPIAFLIFLAANCSAAEPGEVLVSPSVHTHGFDLSDAERLRFEQKAADGDASAAMRLWDYYAIEHHSDDLISSDRCLCRAAELGDATAQWNLGYSMKEGNRPPDQRFPECARQWGSTQKAAIKKLLEISAATQNSSCYELASAYEDGYFGSRDRIKARKYFAMGAQLNDISCWEKLADYCHRGLGGPPDAAQAYYWISLYVRWADHTILGPKAWKTREDIAQNLPLAVLEREWQCIDTFIAQVSANNSETHLPGTFEPETNPEARRVFDEHENDHRNRLRTKKQQSEEPR